MANYSLEAQYPKQQICRDRNMGGLVAWAAYTGTLPIPDEKPPVEFVQLRLVAERIPVNSAAYTDKTINFFLMDPTTKEDLRDLMSAWNTEQREIELSGHIQDVIGTFMPRFAELDTTPDQVAAWYAQNGWPPEPTPERGF